jgi:hypothetical protein
MGALGVGHWGCGVSGLLRGSRISWAMGDAIMGEGGHVALAAEDGT